jgi:HEPN domain-containing protein
LSRKTDSNNPADWIRLCESDLQGISTLVREEQGYEMCRGKLAEVIEKVMKAELIRLGWSLARTHDLVHLFGLLQERASDLCESLRPLTVGYAEIYFMSRYPGYDLEEPDWGQLRGDVAATSEVLRRVKQQLPA